MNPLESRKRLLIGDSELNRAQAVNDMKVLTADVRKFSEPAKLFSTVASSAAVVMAVLAVFRRGQSVPIATKPSWLKNIGRGVGLISILWLALRPQRKPQLDM